MMSVRNERLDHQAFIYVVRNTFFYGCRPNAAVPLMRPNKAIYKNAAVPLIRPTVNLQMFDCKSADAAIFSVSSCSSQSCVGPKTNVRMQAPHHHAALELSTSKVLQIGNAQEV